MTTTMMAVCGVALVALVVVPALRPKPRKRALALARQTGEVEHLVEWVEGKSVSSQVDSYDQLLLDLWRRYERELAAALVMAAVPRCDHKILQYWIVKVMELEPEIAQEVFTDEFLYDHFKPDVAATCGKAGCCG